MRGEVNNSIRIKKPTARPLRVYAFDPGAGHYVGNEMVALVPYEELKAGPVGERFAVVDFDAAEKVYYAGVDLDDPRIIMRSGLDPSESDPRFHQQMVYAVASETLQRFEIALGRRVPWARFDKPEELRHSNKNVPKIRDPGKRRIAHGTLFLFPHAMAEANAFYSRFAQGILFGYFRASATNPGENLPGQLIYTCLSHDIIAHETTHAVLDGLRSFFTEPTNIDVAAFHEAFADLSALFCHFAHKEVLLDTLMKTGGRLYDTKLRGETLATDGAKAQLQTDIAQINPLAQLAQQFGEASGMNRGLRQMLGTPPNSNDINVLAEPHDRGSILVAAVFDAYFTIYTRRTADLFRIFRAGGGSASPVDLPEALAQRLCSEAARTAEEFFTICARAIDYCPPVDIVFGDFLRSILTAHSDLHPDDPDGVRNAFMEAFRLRGIIPKDALSLTAESMCWPQVDETSKLPPVEGLQFGDPNGLTDAEKDANGDLLRSYAKANANLLGFPVDHGAIDAPSFHPMFRIGPRGDLITDMVVELVETRIDERDKDTGPYPFRSGVTLLIWQEYVDDNERKAPRIHYVIPKHRSAERERRQQMTFAAMQRSGRHDENIHRPQQGTGTKPDRSQIERAWRIDFGLIHAGL
jgi:hypothetical protein